MITTQKRLEKQGLMPSGENGETLRDRYGGSMKIRVTPAYGYAHGHAERVLVAAGASSISTDQDGIVTAEVTPQQFETFQLRGVAHKVEVVE